MRIRRNNYVAYAFILVMVIAFFRVIIPAIEDALLNNGRHRYRHLYFLPQNISYNITTRFCNDDVFLVTAVITRPENWPQRLAIRQTWGAVQEVQGKKLHHIFMLAGTDDQSLREKIRQENEQHHDMVVLNFKDHYLNLTFKTVQSLQLITKYCSSAEYVLKADDDVFVNYFALIRVLAGSPRSDFAAGYKFQRAMPVRWRKSKWYTPRDVYPAKVYPPYLAGPAYVMSRDVAYNVHTQGQDVSFLPWEDVFVGMCLKRIRIVPQMDQRFDTYAQQYKQNVSCPIHRIFAVHLLEPKNITAMWNLYRQEDQIPRCNQYIELL
ncbi:beta-1,3-galactosyltransferase 5-like [Glandiceps talaboti]